MEKLNCLRQPGIWSLGMRIVLRGYYEEGLDYEEICRRSKEGSRQKFLSYFY